MSNGQAVCVKVTPPHRVSVALSTYFIALDLGIGVGPYVLGMLRNVMTFPELYAVSGVISLICFVLYYVFYGRHVVLADETVSEDLFVADRK